MTDTPKLWRDMTPEEKGALLLAQYEGKAIEVFCWDHGWSGWTPKPSPFWSQDHAYRIRPEPKRETVTIDGYANSADDCVFSNLLDIHGDTHRITFDLIDGKPDCASIRMEEL